MLVQFSALAVCRLKLSAGLLVGLHLLRDIATIHLLLHISLDLLDFLVHRFHIVLVLLLFDLVVVNAGLNLSADFVVVLGVLHPFLLPPIQLGGKICHPLVELLGHFLPRYILIIEHDFVLEVQVSHLRHEAFAQLLVELLSLDEACNLLLLFLNCVQLLSIGPPRVRKLGDGSFDVFERLDCSVMHCLDVRLACGRDVFEVVLLLLQRLLKGLELITV